MRIKNWCFCIYHVLILLDRYMVLLAAPLLIWTIGINRGHFSSFVTQQTWALHQVRPLLREGCYCNWRGVFRGFSIFGEAFLIFSYFLGVMLLRSGSTLSLNDHSLLEGRARGWHWFVYGQDMIFVIIMDKRAPLFVVLIWYSSSDLGFVVVKF